MNTAAENADSAKDPDGEVERAGEGGHTPSPEEDVDRDASRFLGGPGYRSLVYTAGVQRHP